MSNNNSNTEQPERIYIDWNEREFHLKPLAGYTEYVRTDLSSRASVAAPRDEEKVYKAALETISESACGGECRHIAILALSYPPDVVAASSAVSPSPTPEQPHATLDRLRTLLARYTQPCAEDCDHSQCPLLRELHALVISDALEHARLTVKPLVDRERAGEFVGDLMNLRLQSNSCPADPKQLALDVVKGCSNWHDIQYRIVPRIIALLDRAAPPSTQPSARVAAEGLTAQLFEVEGFGDYTNTQQREAVYDLAYKAFKNFPSVQPVEEQKFATRRKEMFNV